MGYQYGAWFGSPVRMPFAGLVFILAIWSVFWKGLALWHSAGRREPWWFVILLVVNTAGILKSSISLPLPSSSFPSFFPKTITIMLDGAKN